MTASRVAADLLEIQPNTAAPFYHKIRLVITHHLPLQADDIFDEQVELDESYFGGHRKGKRGRGAAGKGAVFSILKRQGKVFTVIIEDTKTETLLPVIKREINLIAGVIWILCRYDVLDVGEFRHEKNQPL